MNKFKQIVFFVLTFTMVSPFLVNTVTNAQTVDTGIVIEDIVFRDINDREFTLYDYLDQGYTVVIELTTTTCVVCWQFMQSGAFERLYRNYGPNGNIIPEKILPIFIETNPSTTLDDLKGTGDNTIGDWVSGHSYPIVDLNKENLESTLKQFLKPGVFSFPTPTFLIICPDKKLVHAGSGISSLNEGQVIRKMENRCATGSSKILENTQFELIEVFPNPVKEELNINFTTIEKVKAQLSISNLLGQVLYFEEDLMLEYGQQRKSINTSLFKSGVYFISISTANGTFYKQFIKN